MRVVGGRFQLTEPLGRGAYGIVWRALDLETKSEVALKLFRHAHRRSAQARARFEEEARIVARLEHPSIARAIAWGTERGRPYIALELAPGEPLDKLIVRRAKERSHFLAEEIARFFEAVCEAIAFAHDQRIVHRDLKPSNVVVSRLDIDGAAIKIVDFGVAKVLDGEPEEETTRGRRVGSLLHMSPEQVDAKPIDHRADVFALGVVLFEMATLRQPWLRDASDRALPLGGADARDQPANETFRVLSRIAREARVVPSSVRRALPWAIDEIALEALAVYPHERPQSVRAFLAELLPALAALALVERGVREIEGRAPSEVALVPTRVLGPHEEAALEDTVLSASRPDLEAGDATAPDTVLAAHPAPTAPVVSTRGRAPLAVALVAIAAAGIAGAAVVFLIKQQSADLVDPRPASRSVSVDPAVIAARMNDGDPPKSPSTANVAGVGDESPRAISDAPKVAAEARRPAGVVEARTKPGSRHPPAKDDRPRDAPLDPLSRDLAKLRANPEDPVLIAALSERIIARARTLPDRARGRSIERRASNAAMTFDAPELELCVRMLLGSAD